MGGCEIPRTDPSAAPLASNTRTLRWAEHLLDPVAVRGGLSPPFLEHPVPVPAGRRRCLGRAIASAAMHPAIHDKQAPVLGRNRQRSSSRSVPDRTRNRKGDTS